MNLFNFVKLIEILNSSDVDVDLINRYLLWKEPVIKSFALKLILKLYPEERKKFLKEIRKNCFNRNERIAANAVEVLGKVGIKERDLSIIENLVDKSFKNLKKRLFFSCLMVLQEWDKEKFFYWLEEGFYKKEFKSDLLKVINFSGEKEQKWLFEKLKLYEDFFLREDIIYNLVKKLSNIRLEENLLNFLIKLKEKVNWYIYQLIQELEVKSKNSKNSRVKIKLDEIVCPICNFINNINSVKCENCGYIFGGNE